MEAIHPRTSIRTITGVFATKNDAENAFQSLLKHGYAADEITLIMSNETRDRLYEQQEISYYLRDDYTFGKGDHNSISTIADAIDIYGKFVALPGLALVIAGNLQDGGVRALSSSVLSDQYAEYFASRINDGEILIDVQPHTARERNMINDLWENYGGYPLIRRITNAA